ncbi:hypothetical protein GCM10010376_34350 [Streptomyces violaceusniger]
MPASPDRHLENARRSLPNCASNCLALADENTIARTPECDAKHCSRQPERLPASYPPTGHATIAARKIIVNELPILSGLPDDRQKRYERDTPTWGNTAKPKCTDTLTTCATPVHVRICSEGPAYTRPPSGTRGNP